MITCFLSNICAKNYQNRLVFVGVIEKQSSDIFGTQCRDVSSYFVTLCGELELEAVMCSHKVDCRLYFNS